MHRRRTRGLGAVLLHLLAAEFADGGPSNASQPLPVPGVPSPPLLQLGPKAVDLAWHRPPGPADSVVSYDVLVTIQRARGTPAERIERSAGHETQFEFSPIPIGARSCFRVRAIGPGEMPARSEYSGETCYSNCECESAQPGAGAKGVAPSPSPARPPVPKPPRPVGPAPADGQPDDDDNKFGGGGSGGAKGGASGADGGCVAAGAPTFLAGVLVGAALAMAISTTACLLSRSEPLLVGGRGTGLMGAGGLMGGGGLLNGRGAHGRSPFGAKPVDEAAASEYAHLTAAEQMDAQRSDGPRGIGGGLGNAGGHCGSTSHYGRRSQAGVALAELEASSASAQHAHARGGRARSPPLPAHHQHRGALAHHGYPPHERSASPARPTDAGLPTLEPAANVDPLAFEAQWVQCQAQPGLTLELRARAPRLPAQEAVEIALAQSGMVCIAAGAVGEVHKAYFAAQLAPTPPGELLMLELVVSRAVGSAGGAAATATFRSLNARHLHALSQHFGSVLTNVLGGERFS